MKKFSVWIVAAPYGGIQICRKLSWGAARKRQMRQDKQNWVGMGGVVVTAEIRDSEGKTVHKYLHRKKKI